MNPDKPYIRPVELSSKAMSVRTLSLGCLFLCSLQVGGFAQPPVSLNEEHIEYSLKGHLWHWADTSHQLQAQQILQLRSAGKGDTLTTEIPSVGDKDASHWVVFVAKNEGISSQDLVVEIYSSKLDTIAFYPFIQENLIRQIPVYSWQTPVFRRDLPYRAFTYRMVLSPQATQTVLLRLVKRNGILSLPIRLYQQPYYKSYIEHEHFRLGLTAGVMLLAFLLGLTLFVLSGQWVYCFYAGHIVGISLLLFAERHYLNQYLLAYSTLLAGPTAWAIGAVLSNFSHNLFSLSFLKIRPLQRNFWTYISWGNSLLSVGIGSWLIAGFPLTNLLYQLVIVCSLAYVGFAAALLVFSLYKRTPEAYLYAIAISPFWILAALTALNALDTIPWVWATKELIDYVPIFEISILGIGLAYTFQRDQRERVKGEQLISQLNKKVLTVRADAQGAERKRIAQDLHDNLGSMMSAIRLTIEAIDSARLSKHEREVYENVLAMTRQAYNEVRLLSHNLQPEELEKFGITEALQRMIAKFNNSQIIRFTLITNQLPPLGKDTEFNLYSICLELISNIIKHSGATEATFEFIPKATQLQVLVTENGKGFIPNNTSDGMGMRNIQERTEQMGGVFKIRSHPGEGTLFQFIIPLTQPVRASTQI